MYQADQFIEYAQRYLGEIVNQNAIDEIRDIKKLDEARNKIKRIIAMREAEEKRQSKIGIINSGKSIKSIEDCDCGDCQQDCDCGDCQQDCDCGDCQQDCDCSDCQ
jgi:hypothetical protein